MFPETYHSTTVINEGKIMADKRQMVTAVFRDRLNAERAFDIHAIVNVFEGILSKTCRNDTYRKRVA